MIVVLAGGVGAARFLQGVVQVVPPQQLTVIVNTGDDRDFYGLHVSPDSDIVIYTLADIVDETHGWGIRNDTYNAMQQLTSYGNENWFELGDRDLATHIHRTNLLRQGKSLSGITDELCKQFGLQLRILPMSDQSIQTHIQTPGGLIHFEEYFVKRWYQDPVNAVRFAGASEAEPAPGVTQAIASAQAVLIAPSNPVTSIGPILAVPGIREGAGANHRLGGSARRHSRAASEARLSRPWTLGTKPVLVAQKPVGKSRHGFATRSGRGPIRVSRQCAQPAQTPISDR